MDILVPSPEAYSSLKGNKRDINSGRCGWCSGRCGKCLDTIQDE